MFGVPGRSKGCEACRRRRIKCDIQEPDCGQYRKSSRQCEGPKKEMTFIEHKLRALLPGNKRQYYQRPAPGNSSPSDDQIQSGATSTEMMDSDTIAPQLNSASIYINAMFDIFLPAYLPSSSLLKPVDCTKIITPTKLWPMAAIDLPNREPLLTVALQALCITKTVRAFDDQVLLRQGMAGHGRACVANVAICDQWQTKSNFGRNAGNYTNVRNI